MGEGTIFIRPKTSKSKWHVSRVDDVKWCEKWGDFTSGCGKKMKFNATDHQLEKPEDLCGVCGKGAEVEGYFTPDFLDNVGRPLTIAACKGPSNDSRAPGVKEHQMPCVVLGITSIGTSTPRSQTIHLDKDQWKKMKDMVGKVFEQR